MFIIMLKTIWKSENKIAEIFQTRKQNIEHVGIYIAEHCMQYSCVAGALKHPMAGMPQRSMWLGLYSEKKNFGKYKSWIRSTLITYEVHIFLLTDNMVVFAVYDRSTL